MDATNQENILPNRVKIRLLARHNTDLLALVEAQQVELKRLKGKAAQTEQANKNLVEANKRLITANNLINTLKQQLNAEQGKTIGNSKLLSLVRIYLENKGAYDFKIFKRYLDFCYKGNNPNRYFE